MDLKDLDLQSGAEAGVKVELKHPVTGDALGWTLHLRGEDAPTIMALRLEQRRRRLAHFEKSGTFRVDPSVLDEETIECLVVATVGWEGLVLNGQAFAFSEANARTLYSRYPWAREQAADAIRQRVNFLPRSASGS